MQADQSEILVKMQDKFQKLVISNFEYFEVCCGIVTVLVVFFAKL